MHNTPLSESRRWFLEDLRAIRESSQVSLQQIYEDTRIPISALREFETTGLFDNPLFNRVYLGSLVISYAKVVGIQKRLMVEALEEALEHRYDGELRRRHFGIADEVDDGLHVVTNADAIDLGEEEIFDATPDPESQPALTPPSAFRRPGFDSWKWVTGVVVTAVIVGIVWRQWPEREIEMPSVMEQSAEPLGADEPAQIVIGTPFSVILHPVGILEPVRITIDGNLRRPYWLEQGETVAIEVQDSLAIQGAIDRMRLFVNGWEIPLSAALDEEADVVRISREWLYSHLDELTEKPVPMPVDTIRVQ